MILVCSAWEEENKYLGYLKEPYLVLNLGIGYLNAALNLEVFLLNNKESVEKIFFIGTAGIIANSEKVFNIEDSKVYSVAEVKLGDYLSKLKHSYVPNEYEFYNLEIIDGYTNAKAFSNLEISKSTDLSKLILASESDNLMLLENMELYGVAAVAARKRLPLSSLLVTTNYTNTNAHQDWFKNHKEASKKLCLEFQKIIDKDFLRNS